MNLQHLLNREILKNKVVSYIIVAVMLLQILVDVLGQFVDIFHKM